MEVFFLATHRAAPNITVSVLREDVPHTLKHRYFFWVGVGIILVVLGICGYPGLLSHEAMMHTKYGDLDLGVSPAQVARLTDMEPGKRRERQVWYMKLHPRFPRITVSTDPTRRGDWAEEEVMNKHIKED